MQLRILSALEKTGRWTTRQQITNVTGDRKGFAKAMGAPTTGQIKSDTLEGQGYVDHKPNVYPLEYQITKLGLAALAGARRRGEI